MEKEYYYVTCSACSKELRLTITSEWYGKKVIVTCKCKHKFPATIPKSSPASVDEMLRDVKGFLGDIPENLHDFLFGSNSKKR